MPRLWFTASLIPNYVLEMASLSCDYTANNRMEFGGARIDILAADQFLAKLADYDSQYSKSHPGFECDLGPLPASERTCCDFLNRLLHQLQRMDQFYETKMTVLNVSYDLQLTQPLNSFRLALPNRKTIVRVHHVVLTLSPHKRKNYASLSKKTAVIPTPIPLTLPPLPLPPYPRSGLTWRSLWHITRVV